MNCWSNFSLHILRYWDDDYDNWQILPIHHIWPHWLTITCLKCFTYLLNDAIFMTKDAFCFLLQNSQLVTSVLRFTMLKNQEVIEIVYSDTRMTWKFDFRFNWQLYLVLGVLRVNTISYLWVCKRCSCTSKSFVLWLGTEWFKTTFWIHFVLCKTIFCFGCNWQNSYFIVLFLIGIYCTIFTVFWLFIEVIKPVLLLNNCIHLSEGMKHEILTLLSCVH